MQQCWREGAGQRSRASAVAVGPALAAASAQCRGLSGAVSFSRILPALLTGCLLFLSVHMDQKSLVLAGCLRMNDQILRYVRVLVCLALFCRY